MVKQLFTVGYEGASIETFIANLRANKVKCVLDVREAPLSRKRGFSKTQLGRALNDADIRYIHLRELGTPKSVRDELKSTRDYTAFFEKMNLYLAAKKDAIETALSYVLNSTCCLMCFERLASECHRKLVAQKIKAKDGNGLQITHI